MAIKDCANCQAWEPIKGGMKGECRRNAPVIMDGNVCMGLWPITLPKAWCLDHVNRNASSVPKRRSHEQE